MYDYLYITYMFYRDDWPRHGNMCRLVKRCPSVSSQECSGPPVCSWCPHVQLCSSDGMNISFPSGFLSTDPSGVRNITFLRLSGKSKGIFSVVTDFACQGEVLVLSSLLTVAWLQKKFSSSGGMTEDSALSRTVCRWLQLGTLQLTHWNGGGPLTIPGTPSDKTHTNWWLLIAVPRSIIGACK